MLQEDKHVTCSRKELPGLALHGERFTSWLFKSDEGTRRKSPKTNKGRSVRSAPCYSLTKNYLDYLPAATGR